MPNYNYLLLGGGMTAAAAIEGIRKVDEQGSIGVVSADPHPPYDRPPLSKGLWKDTAIDEIWRETDKYAATLHLGRSAQALDTEKKQATDDAGTVYGYGKLLLATGSTPRRLPFGGEEILYYRTVDDYRRLRVLTEHHSRFAVIGGGFIGTEIAAALAMNGKQVTLVIPDSAIGSKMCPPDLAESLNAYYREKGVEVLTGSKATGYEKRDGAALLKVQNTKTQEEREVSVEAVVAGIGVHPNVELAEAAGLKVDDGVQVDASLRTSHPDIYASGDVASFYNPALEKWLRVEHEDNATTMGGCAGAAMAGQAVNYDYLPFFYSDLFDMGYEAIGEVDSRLEMVADWKEPCKEGVIYYVREGRVRGVLLWNIFEQVEEARKLIASGEQVTAAELKGRITA
jgi:NADPH-dependent 2,4-dienoyl-CoA reductase/sulfur reductase-like enzyme